MESTAFASHPQRPLTQRELLGLLLGCAARGSAAFPDALRAVSVASGAPEPAALTKELLTDLTIRGWIELRAPGADGAETAVPRMRYELELTADRNWQPGAPGAARFALTDRGREHLSGDGPSLRT